MFKDRFYFDKALCFHKAPRGVSEGEDGGGARLAGSCSPAAGAASALGPGEAMSGSPKEESSLPRSFLRTALGTPRLGPSAEEGCPRLARDPLCRAFMPRCVYPQFYPHVCCCWASRCTCAGKHKGDSSLNAHPVSLARGKVRTVRCGCLNLPCFSLFLLGSVFGCQVCIYLVRLDWYGAEGKTRQSRVVETRSASMNPSTHTVSASCKSP